MKIAILSALGLGLIASQSANAQFVYRPAPVTPVPTWSPPMHQPSLYQPRHQHRPMVYSLQSFDRFYQPRPGHNTVWIVHPVTGRPVEDCFDLPRGVCSHDIHIHNRMICFEIDRGRDVKIIFNLNGTVSVID